MTPGGIVQKVSFCRNTFSSMFTFYFTVQIALDAAPTMHPATSYCSCFLYSQTKQSWLGECHEKKKLADFHSVMETKCKLEECEDFVFYRFQEMHDVFQ